MPESNIRQGPSSRNEDETPVKRKLASFLIDSRVATPKSEKTPVKRFCLATELQSPSQKSERKLDLIPSARKKSDWLSGFSGMFSPFLAQSFKLQLFIFFSAHSAGTRSDGGERGEKVSRALSMFLRPLSHALFLPDKPRVLQKNTRVAPRANLVSQKIVTDYLMPIY